jgi:hypothetical protein
MAFRVGEVRKSNLLHVTARRHTWILSASGGQSLVKADDQDPVQRWHSISEFYVEFAAMPHWEFLAPMVGLTEWVAKQPFVAKIFPGTSHEWLCVHLHTGYNPDLPFFSCGVREDGQFECELWAAVGSSRGKREVLFRQACETFAEFVGHLHRVAAEAEPSAAPGGDKLT